MNTKENRASFEERIKGLPTEDQQLIMLAYDLAKESHRTQLRDEGIRYFEHVRAVAIILMDELGIMERDLIIACLLHDAVEDSATFGNRRLAFSVWKETAMFRLSRTFNERVANIVIALTKPLADGVEIVTKKQAYAIYFDGLRNGGASVLLGKMCDRLHNLRSLSATLPEKIQSTIRETEETYYPLFEETMDLPEYQKERMELFSKIKDEITQLKQVYA